MQRARKMCGIDWDLLWVDLGRCRFYVIYIYHGIEWNFLWVRSGSLLHSHGKWLIYNLLTIITGGVPLQIVKLPEGNL